MANDGGPLTEDDFKALKEQESNLAKAKVEIDRAKRAGIDVEEHEKNYNELRTQLGKLRAAYFPGR